jgi:hypothetical protein
MVSHLCDGEWLPGPVAGCEFHDHRGPPAADVRPYDDRRFDDVVEGVARTGAVSPKGTVTHRRYWSGRQAAKVTTGDPIRQKANEMAGFAERFDYDRNGQVIDRETGRRVSESWLISKLTQTSA